MVQTQGISPKVVADLVVTVLGFALAYVPLNLDPAVAAAIAKVLGSLAAYFARPGAVGEQESIGKPSDARLSRAVRTTLGMK